MKKLGISIITSISVLGLIGCGGGSGSSTTASVSGTVEASKLAGVTVTDRQGHTAITDTNGYFKLNGVSAGTKIYLYSGNAEIGSVNAETNMQITPLVLADNNTTLAAKVGVALHILGNCPLYVKNCDLSNANVSLNEPLVKHLEYNNSLEVDGKKVEITDQNISDYESINPQMVSDNITYKGVFANGGNLLIKFNINDNNLYYEYNTSANSDSGNEKIISLDNWKIDNHSILYKAENDNDYFVITPTMMLGYVSDGNAMFFSLSNPSDINESDFNNTRFNVIISSTSSGNTLGVVDFNITNNNKTFTFYTMNDEVNGTWDINNSILNLYDENGTKIATALAKKAMNKMALLINLNINLNKEVALATKAIDITPDDLKNQKIYYVWDENITNPNSDFCVGYNIVNNDGTTVEFKDTYCSDNEPVSGKVTLEYNPTINVNGEDITLHGWLKWTEGSNSGYMIMDPVLGIYMAPNRDSLNFGTNRVIK